jgi:hypothetical protein
VTAVIVGARRQVGERWYWVVPVLVAAFIYETRGAYIPLALAALIGSAVVLAASRRPDVSLLVLIVGLPAQGLLLAQFYAWGMPAALVRPLTAWKEALALGVVVAAVRGFRAARKRLDRFDVLGLAYTGTVLAYAIVPRLFAPHAPMLVDARSLGFRSTAGFVVLLLAARHAPLPADFLARAARVVMIVGTVASVVAIYEYFFSDSWNTWVVDKVQYLKYQVDILGATTLFNYTDIRRYGYVGGTEVLRVGSVLLDPIRFGFFLLLPFAVAVERRLRAGWRRGSTTVLVLISTALVLTQTRAAILGALVIACLAVGPAAGRAPNRRLQFTFVIAAGLLVALPAASATGLRARVESATSGSDQSTIDHVQGFWNGVHAVQEAPLGHGLGTSAGVGQRFANATARISENYYLQVGIEAGLIAMALFVALTVAVALRLNRAARKVPDAAISAVRGAAVGLAIGAFLLHTWLEFAVAWTFWGLAGACLGISERAREQDGAGGVPAGAPAARH